MTVTALIPAHNEAERVGATVSAARSVPMIDRVVVIDDGSTDNTTVVAAAAGAEVVRVPVNRGKGGALQAGLDLVREATDVLVLLAADLGESASEAALLLSPELDGQADMAIEVLPRPAGSGGIGLVKTLARWGIARLGPFDAQAPLSGQRALSRRAWEAATPFADGFGVEVALTVHVARAGLTIAEVPTAMRHAATGRDIPGFMHRGRQFIAVARTLVRLALGRQSAAGPKTG
ncbi:MAG: glycosyltransferase family 2 protein [Coriobacteriia bacterium]|nr:glycosyltransferase family 2 protein [Coriobacteriia bacterium]